MENEMNDVEKSVWCHVFLGRCATAENVAQAERMANDALQVLRRRGLVKDASRVIADRVLYPVDSIPVRVCDR